MSDSEEPLDSTPRDEAPLCEFGKPLPAPMATRDQGEVMDTIWQLETLVTPQRSPGSQNLKKYWLEFMDRFRHHANPLDESRKLLVICHIPKTHLTRQHNPKDLFSMFLDERAFSVWTVNASNERGIIHFEKHPTCLTAPGWRNFTMRENALPDIALTGVSGWQNAKILMVNTYRPERVGSAGV